MSTDCPYVTEGPLGRGGQAHTFRARHRDSGEVVALKRFRLAEADTWKAHELFERECGTLAALDHASVPRFIAAGQGDDGELWLAMELIEGESLATSVRAGRPLEPGVVEDFALQLLGVFDYLHGQLPPVIHRDVKPANVMLKPDGWLTLVDFGSVRTALRPEGGSTVVGTFGYLAPEQLHGEATAVTDLFSLGMTLAALATGIDAANLPRKGLRLDVVSCLPEGRLRTLIAALTAPEPSERPASAKAVRTMLAAWRMPVVEPRTIARADAPANPTPVHYRRRRGPIGAVLAALAMAIGTFVLNFYERIILPRRHLNRLRRAMRRSRGDITRHQLARERAEARLAYEQLQVTQSRRSLAYLTRRPLPRLPPPVIHRPHAPPIAPRLQPRQRRGQR